METIEIVPKKSIKSTLNFPGRTDGAFFGTEIGPNGALWVLILSFWGSVQHAGRHSSPACSDSSVHRYQQ